MSKHLFLEDWITDNREGRKREYRELFDRNKRGSGLGSFFESLGGEWSG